MPKPRPIDWLLLMSLVAMWGSSFLLTKLAVTALPPTSVVAGRLGVAAVALLALARWRRLGLPRSRLLWGYLIAIAVTGNCLPFFLISWGQQSIDSGLAGILMAVMPLAVLVLAHYFVDGERLTAPRAAGFGLGFLGIVVLTGPEALSRLQGQGASLVPQLAVLGGALCYAVTTIIARRRPDSEPLLAAAGVMLTGSLLMLPTAAAVDLPWPQLPGWAPLLAVAALGLVCTAAATVVYFTLIGSAGPTFLALINYLIPLWALGMGALFLGERPGWNVLAALGLILGGIGLSQWGGRARPQKELP